jgi:hypothetical protein
MAASITAAVEYVFESPCPEAQRKGQGGMSYGEWSEGSAIAEPLPYQSPTHHKKHVDD